MVFPFASPQGCLHWITIIHHKSLKMNLLPVSQWDDNLLSCNFVTAVYIHTFWKLDIHLPLCHVPQITREHEKPCGQGELVCLKGMDIITVGPHQLTSQLFSISGFLIEIIYDRHISRMIIIGKVKKKNLYVTLSEAQSILLKTWLSFKLNFVCDLPLLYVTFISSLTECSFPLLLCDNILKSQITNRKVY